MPHRFLNAFRLPLACAALAALSFQAYAAKPTAGAWTAVGSTLNYQAIALAADDTVNPLRGYYRWRNQESIPQAEPALDAYQRYFWRDLEPSEGTYDFSAIQAAITTARNEGRRFAFRLRMMAGYDDNQVYAPAYLVNHPSCSAGCGFWADDSASVSGLTYVPDWNDAFVMQRARALLTALAGALGSAADLAWIDVGLYGQYGEWTVHSNLYAGAPAGIVPITDANKREYAKMHFDAFPGAQHVMFALYTNRDALAYGLNQQAITSKPVGLRVDCLSRYGFFDQWTNHATDWAQFSSRWQTAPFVAEFCPFSSGDPQNNPATARQQAAQFHISTIGNGNFATSLPDAQRWSSLTAAEQSDLLMLGREAGYRYAISSVRVDLTTAGALSVTPTVRNHGNAPAYEAWSLRAELVTSGGSVAWSGVIPLNLKASIGAGSSQSLKQTWTLPGSLASGTYTLRLIARDPLAATNPYARRPLRFSNIERAADGGVSVVALRKR